MTNHSEITEYNSLNDIRLKKEAIRKEIDADDAKIQTLWNSLFTKPEILSRNASPSKRLQSLLQVGAGAFDGALLAWKLYRRFLRHCLQNILTDRRCLSQLQRRHKII